MNEVDELYLHQTMVEQQSMPRTPTEEEFKLERALKSSKLWIKKAISNLEKPVRAQEFIGNMLELNAEAIALFNQPNYFLYIEQQFSVSTCSQLLTKSHWLCNSNNPSKNLDDALKVLADANKQLTTVLNRRASSFEEKGDE